MDQVPAGDRGPWSIEGRELPLAARYREGHVERLRAPLEQHGHPVAGLDPLGGALEVLYVADALAVDLPNHVAPLQPRLGRCALILNTGHDHAVRRAQVELPLDLRGDGAGVEAEEALALAAGLDDLCGLLGRLTELDLERPIPLVPPDPD